MAAAKLGETAIMVGVGTTTTAAVAAAMVETGEAGRILVVAQDAAKGATKAEPYGVVATAPGKATEGGGTAHEFVQCGTARHLLPLVFGLEHRPRRGDRGSR